MELRATRTPSLSMGLTSRSLVMEISGGRLPRCYGLLASVCLFTTPWLSDGYLRTEGVQPVGLDQAVSESDVLFLLAGVTTENEGFLTRDRLSKIREDATVVLASRAEIVDFDAFLALASSGAFRAVVDVYPEEPVPQGSAWRRAENTQFSAHLAGGLSASYARIREAMLDDIGQILKGHPPLRMQRANPKQAAAMRSR